MSQFPPSMAVFPWSGGHGVSHRDDWWRYLLQQEEAYRLDVLIALAFMHEDIRKRLLEDRDIDLMAVFQLSLETTRWLAQVEAHSIADLALAITLWQQEMDP